MDENKEIKKDELTITPDTGEVIDYSGKVVEEQKTEQEAPTVDESATTVDSEVVEEQSKEEETVEEKQEEVTTTEVDETSDEEKPAEEKTEETSEESETEPVTEESTEEEKSTEEQKEEEQIDIEAIQKELAELKAEKEEEQRVRELIEVANHVEAEYDRVVKGINQALKETLEKYQIPTDKTLQELAQDDPAKADIARALIAQAKQALDFNTQQLSNVYKTKERDVIFSKAERLFNKYEMTNEQADIAADTFIKILSASGLQDLDGDLMAKVELSVAQAKYKAPTPIVEVKKEEVVEVVETPPVVEPDAPAVEEPSTEEPTTEEKDKTEEVVEEDSKPAEFEIKRGVAKEAPTKKVDLSGFKEGIDGGAKAATTSVDTSEVLHKLASLPYKERQEFLKKNHALVTKAMRDFNIKNSRARR